MIALKEKLMDIRTPIYQKSITFTDYYFSGVVHDLASNRGDGNCWDNAVAVSFFKTIKVE